MSFILYPNTAKRLRLTETTSRDRPVVLIGFDGAVELSEVVSEHF